MKIFDLFVKIKIYTILFIVLILIVVVTYLVVDKNLFDKTIVDTHTDGVVQSSQKARFKTGIDDLASYKSNAYAVSSQFRGDIKLNSSINANVATYLTNIYAATNKHWNSEHVNAIISSFGSTANTRVNSSKEYLTPIHAIALQTIETGVDGSFKVPRVLLVDGMMNSGGYTAEQALNIDPSKCTSSFYRGLRITLDSDGILQILSSQKMNVVGGRYLLNASQTNCSWIEDKNDWDAVAHYAIHRVLVDWNMTDLSSQGHMRNFKNQYELAAIMGASWNTGLSISTGFRGSNGYWTNSTRFYEYIEYLTRDDSLSIIFTVADAEAKKFINGEAAITKLDSTNLQNIRKELGISGKGATIEGIVYGTVASQSNYPIQMIYNYRVWEQIYYSGN